MEGREGSSVNVNEEAGWDALMKQIEGIVGFCPQKLVDEDDCDIEGVDVLENGLKVYIQEIENQNVPAPAVPGNQQPLPVAAVVKPVNTQALRSLAFEALNAIKDQSASLRLLSLVRIIITNLAKVKNSEKSLLVKYQTVNTKKLLRAAKVTSGLRQRLLLALGFVDVNGDGRKLTLHESTATSEFSGQRRTSLDELFVEFSQARAFNPPLLYLQAQYHLKKTR